MSWDAYVTNNLMCPVDSEGNTLKSAALLGLDGGVWAQSADFPAPTAEEFAVLIQALSDVSVSSLHLGGVKYMRIAGEVDKTLRGRKEKLGFIMRKTESALVFGLYEEPTCPAGTCSKIVETLGDYLQEQGY